MVKCSKSEAKCERQEVRGWRDEINGKLLGRYIREAGGRDAVALHEPRVNANQSGSRFEAAETTVLVKPSISYS